MNETKKVEIGSVWQTSWGYDQTNYDFIIVESISPTGKTCICRRASYTTVGHTCQQNIQKPEAKGYGKTFRMIIDENSASLKGSYIFCGNEDSDSKRFGWFSLVNEGDVFYETNSMYGH